MKTAFSLSKHSVSCRKLVAAKKYSGQDINNFLSLTFEELNHELTTVNQTSPGYSIVTYCIIIIVTKKLWKALLNPFKLYWVKKIQVLWPRKISYNPIKISPNVVAEVFMSLVNYLKIRSAPSNHQTGFIKNQGTINQSWKKTEFFIWKPNLLFFLLKPGF